MSQWDFGIPPAGEAASRPGEYGEYDDYSDYDDYGAEISPPVTYERDVYAPDASEPDAFEGDRYRQPAPPAAGFEPDAFEGDRYRQPAPPATPGPGWDDDSWPPRRPRRRRRRWLVPALVIAAAAAVGGAVAVTSGPGRPAAAASSAPLRPLQTAPRTAAPPPGMRPPLTMAQARQVLARYTAANNAANAQRSDTVLATIETGSSYAIDAGIYRVQRAQNAAPYPAFGPERALYYIPRQPAAYPHWFVVQASNANLANPGKVTGTEYLLFTQAAPGAPWENAIEPYEVAGSSAPRIALGAGGFATAVSSQATSLAVSPARIGQLTAASLDGSGPVGTPANLADRLDQAFWHSKIPAAAITDRHAPAPGQVFGLATTDGGALLFYTDAAQVTLTPPGGQALNLSVPGFYSPGQSLSRASLGYLEQFAAYVPPRGGSHGPRVVADYSGVISGN
jgi:hypothetical protein